MKRYHSFYVVYEELICLMKSHVERESLLIYNCGHLLCLRVMHDKMG